MEVLHSDWLYRNAIFSQEKNPNLWFELITWPHVLTIHGDMGTWTFSRVENMFDFFRCAKESQLRTNPSYWSEKLCGGVHGGSDQAKVWSEDLFRSDLMRRIKEDYGDFSGNKMKELLMAVNEDILSRQGQWELVTAANEFSYEFEEDRDNRGYLERIESHRKARRFHLDSESIPDGMTYSYHFLWCLYAIVWGIRQWDRWARSVHPVDILDRKRMEWLFGDPCNGASRDQIERILRDTSSIKEARRLIDKFMLGEGSGDGV